MKKISVVFILVSIFISLLQIQAKAADKSYNIDNLIINAAITEKGDVEIKEAMTYDFQGSFNGIYRNLSKTRTSGYTISKVEVRDKDNRVTELKLSSGGENNTYQIIESSDASQVKMFSKSTDEAKTFLINYTILDAAIKYNDLGELYWNFYSVKDNIAVKEVELNLSLKNKDFNMDKFKYWSYVDGRFTTNYDSQGIHLKGSNLTSLLGLKVVFQPEFLKNPAQFYNDKTFQDAGSQVKANIPFDTANTELPKSKSNRNDFVVFVIFLMIIAVIYIFINENSKRNKKIKKAIEEYREGYDFFKDEVIESPPKDISPALVNLMYHEHRVTDCVIPSTLFYLCQKGYYTIKNNMDIKGRDTKALEVEDLTFIRNFEKSQPSIRHLSSLLTWLSIYEKEGELTFKSIEKSVKSSQGSIEFRKKYSSFEFELKLDAEKEGFYKIIEGKTILSNETYNEKLKWLAYRNYLQRVISQEDGASELENIDEALIYATALEISTSSLEAFSKKIGKVSYGDSDNYGEGMNLYYPFFFTNLMMWDTVNHDVSENHSNNSSSGTDGGFGGFSSGGDFSGGGGDSSGGGGDSGAF